MSDPHDAAASGGLRRRVGQALCKLRGCNYEDNGSVGPESGCEAWYCSRCGNGFTHIYY